MKTLELHPAGPGALVPPPPTAWASSSQLRCGLFSPAAPAPFLIEQNIHMSMFPLQFGVCMRVRWAGGEKEAPELRHVP